MAPRAAAALPPPLLLPMLLQAAAPSAAKLRIPTRTLSEGVELPMLVMGDGVGWGRPTNWTLWLELAGKGAGIDSAWDYHSQPAIPAGIAAAGLARGDVFITSKIPCGGYDGGVEPMNASMAEWYIAKDLAELNTTYVDLMLMHHVCRTFDETKEVWGVLEAMRRRGQARAIGVSNFDTPDLDRLRAAATEPIAVNQCHFAVGQMDNETIAYCAQHGIALESYSTLHGSVGMDHPAIARVAARHNVSAAVVMLRYVSARGIAVVTASDRREYDVDDAAMFGVQLTPADVAELDALQTGPRTCSDCYSLPCRQCQQALRQAGCEPTLPSGAPGGAACLACAATHPAEVAAACGGEAMVAKGCGA